MQDEPIDELTPPAKEKEDRAAILPGYRWSKTHRRYISNRTGKPISDAELRRLLNQHIADAEGRMGAIATTFHEGRITPAVFVEAMAQEQRRLTVQSAALGKGGFDELDMAALIALALLLNKTNEKLVGTARDIIEGDVSLPQLLNRTEGYVGEARREFFKALQAGLIASAIVGSDSVIIERRLLHARRSCADCIRYHSMGWQQVGTLPIPSVACACGSHCRCEMLHMTVPRAELDQWIGRMR